MILKDRDGTPKCVITDEKALVYESGKYRMYRALSLDEQQTYLLRVPLDAAQNGEIDSEAETLKLLKAKSDKLEEKYAQVIDDPDKRIHYDWLFPQLVDTFILGEDQGYRQANLLSVLDGNLDDFYTLYKLKKTFKVDAKTATWILGRFFKLLTFLDDIGVYIEFSTDSVLIEPQYHRVVYIGWTHTSETNNYNNGKAMAQSILDWLISNGTEHEDEFRELVEGVANFPDDYVIGGEELHEMLYSSIKLWWGHKYYPFTYFDIASGKWERISNTPIGG